MFTSLKYSTAIICILSLFSACSESSTKKTSETLVVTKDTACVYSYDDASLRVFWAGYKTEDVNVFAFFHYTPDAILVEASSPYKTLEELMNFAKKNPGQLTFSGSGTYSANHLLTISLNKKAKVKTTYVPFKGTGAAVQALVGKVVVAEAGYSTVAAKQGSKVRMLAVASESRLPAYPNVPTFKELGFDIVSGAYRGYALPKSASAATVKEWSDRIMKINSDPKFKKQMEDGAFVVVNIGHDQIDDFMKQQKAANEAIAKELGLIK